MGTSQKVIRQSVTMPANLANKVRRMAKGRRTSASRMLVELVEEGIELRKRKEAEFLNLAGRFRAATDPKDVERLGNEMGHMIFGE
jgi:metal-responsive CopG/Arc/MetJ family transcriptional regulator